MDDEAFHEPNADWTSTFGRIVAAGRTVRNWPVSVLSLQDASRTEAVLVDCRIQSRRGMGLPLFIRACTTAVGMRHVKHRFWPELD